jgi:hypothetical protein
MALRREVSRLVAILTLHHSGCVANDEVKPVILLLFRIERQDVGVGAAEGIKEGGTLHHEWLV